MQKISKRQILREAQKLYDENQSLKKEANRLLQMMFGVCVKLYRIDPKDNIFRESDNEEEQPLKPSFLKAIKEAANSKSESESTDTKDPLTGIKKAVQQ